MQITNHNYEAFALDYIEGTLSARDRAAFEQFLRQQPELARQVASLRQAMPVLTADASISFAGKAALKRRSPIRVWLYRSAAAAAVLLIAALGYVRFGTSGTEPAATSDDPLLAIDRPLPDILPESRPAAVLAEPSTTVAAVPATPTVATIAPTSEPPRKTVASAASRPQPELTGLNRPLALVTDLNVPAIPTDRLAEGRRIRVVSVSEGYVVETPEMPADEIRLPNDRGFLNLLSLKGMRQLVSGIVTPLSEISPVSVYENNSERVVTIASIPVSRKPNQILE